MSYRALRQRTTAGAWDVATGRAERAVSETVGVLPTVVLTLLLVAIVGVFVLEAGP